jgi:hypothetical protein
MALSQAASAKTFLIFLTKLSKRFFGNLSRAGTHCFVTEECRKLYLGPML